jgi:hypothetical protein
VITQALESIIQTSVLKKEIALPKHLKMEIIVQIVTQLVKNAIIDLMKTA